MALQHFVWPWTLFEFLILYTVGGTLGRGKSPSQALTYTQYSTNTNTNTHTQPSMPEVGFVNPGPSIRASEDSLCPSPLGHCDLLEM
jgi:hypothetical protein